MDRGEVSSIQLLSQVCPVVASSLELVTWFESLLHLMNLRYLASGFFHSLNAVLSPYAHRNTFPIYAEVIHPPLSHVLITASGVQ